jgi:hypothetical protein
MKKRLGHSCMYRSGIFSAADKKKTNPVALATEIVLLLNGITELYGH